MKKILIGTHNKGKFKEISYLLSKKIKKVSPVKLKIKSPKETGRTFSMNSKLKAKYFSRFTKLPVISDDSGLCIKVLGKKPGIYSARWGGNKNNFNLAIKRVYKELKKNDMNWNKIKQTARFICALTIYWPNNQFINVIGKVEGTISRFKKGNNGFGYDPIFIPLNKKLTFGQMNPKEKYKIDHRAKAFKKIKKFF